jgi:hypothetical protein
MKKALSVFLLSLLALLSVSAQNLNKLVNSKLIFTNKVTYQGFATVSGEKFYGYFIFYWNDDNSMVALETMDREHYPTGLIIIVPKQNVVMMLDKRELRGIVTKPIHNTIKLLDCSATALDSSKTIAGLQCQGYKCSYQNKKYEFWLSNNTVKMAKPLGTLNFYDYEFITLPADAKGVVTQYTCSNNSLLTSLKALSVELNKYFVIDLSDYKLSIYK